MLAIFSVFLPHPPSEGPARDFVAQPHGSSRSSQYFGPLCSGFVCSRMWGRDPLCHPRSPQCLCFPSHHQDELVNLVTSRLYRSLFGPLSHSPQNPGFQQISLHLFRAPFFHPRCVLLVFSFAFSLIVFFVAVNIFRRSPRFRSLLCFVVCGFVQHLSCL